jgi:thymidylate kinase
MESQGDEFRRTVDRAYRELAELFPRRIVTIDAAQTVEDIATEIRERIRDLA